ncbi:MAG: hypothetical protein HY810_07545 [Candidatus Omnitrophica bacterium]|nr:hypothetical protein [Candidatus Omnitrophota bacterium]
MAIFTPRGLKIRISIPYAFALLSRLYPKVSAFRVLKTVEGIELLPKAVTFITAIICFILKIEPVRIFYLVFASYLIITLINTFGFYVIPGLVSIGTIFSYISGYGIYLISLIIIGFILTGWQGLMALFAAKSLGWVITFFIELLQTKRIYNLGGHAFTASERNFFNAYRLHASRMGVTTNIDVADEELKEEYYMKSLEELSYKWPEVVNRFTTD